MTGAPIAVVVTAAGSSERFGSGKKELARIDGRSVLDLALSSFLELPGLQALVITSPRGLEAELRAAISPDSLSALEDLGPGRFAIVAGGESRRDSVRLGLEELARIFDAGTDRDGAREGAEGAVKETALLDELVALVHDGARPWASAELARRVARTAAQRGAAVPVMPLVDTPKELGSDGTIVGHLSRSSLGAAQTPQGFRLGSLLAAHRRAAAECLECTDDAALWDHFVGPVAFVSGEEANRKLTYARDLPRADSRAGSDSHDEGDNQKEGNTRNSDSPSVLADTRISPILVGGGAPSAGDFRIGQGWDLHRLVPERPLLIGGVEVPSELGEDAHSDGDVLLHAVIDALLGAAALGDIGTHFPPSDEKWRGADSGLLARRASSLVRDAGWEIGNLDCTVILEAPRLGPYKDAIRESVAACLGISPNAVSVKAKTMEGLGEVGEGRAVEAMAIVSLVRSA